MPILPPLEVEDSVRIPSGARLYQAPRGDAPSVVLRLAEGESHQGGSRGHRQLRILLGITLEPPEEFIRELRERLERHRATSPLFNTARFTRHLERAYEMIWARHAQGLSPAEIDVPALEAAGLSAAPASP